MRITIEGPDVTRELAIYIMERCNVVTLLKDKEIEVDELVPIDLDKMIDVVNAFLANHNLKGLVIREGTNIRLQIPNHQKIDNYNNVDILTCPHCGKVSIYKEEMDIHIKIHYLGF